MASLSEDPVPALWHREEVPGRSASRSAWRARHWRRFTVAALLLAVAGAAAGLLAWLAPPPRPAYVPLFVTEYQSSRMPVNAWAAQDRDAFLAAGYFPGLLAAAAGAQDLAQLGRQLDDLRTLPAGDLVVHLSAFADAGAGGRLVVLTADAAPTDVSGRLPLRTALDALCESPARRKLLILDVARPVADLRRNILIDDAAGRVPTEVAEALEAYTRRTGTPARLLVLASAAPGEVSLSPEVLGRSLLGHYLDAGLRGWAETYPDPGHPRDGRVTARELAAFVRARVSRFARLAGGGTQTPTLLGDGTDFDVSAPDHGRPAPPPELAPPTPYPDWLKAAWAERDRARGNGRLALDPEAFRLLETQALRAEDAWRAGLRAPRLQFDLAEAVGRATRAFAAARAVVPVPAEPRSLALAEELGARPDPAAAAELNDLFDKLAALPPTLPAPQREAERAKLLTAALAKLKDRPDLDVAAAAFGRAASDPSPSPESLAVLSDLLRARRPTPEYAETLVLERLANLGRAVPASAWPAGAVRHALRAARAGEQAEARISAFPWVRRLLVEGDRARAEGTVLLLAAGYADPADADTALVRAASISEAALGHARVIEEAVALYAEVLGTALTDRHFAVALPSSAPAWEAMLAAAGELAPELVPPPADGPGLTAEELQERMGRLRRKADALRDRREEFRRPVRPEARKPLLDRAADPAAGPDVLADLDTLLACPWLSAGDRVTIWETRDAAARRLAQRVLDLDHADDAAGRRTPPPDAASGGPAGQSRAELARVRLRAALAALRFAGVAAEQLKPLEEVAAGPSPDWSTAADRVERIFSSELRRLTGRLAPAAQRERAAAVIPSPESLVAEGLPPVRARFKAEAARGLWAYLAAGYRHQARDLFDPAVRAFYSDAAAAYGRFGSGMPELVLAVAGPESPLELTPDRPVRTVRFTVTVQNSRDRPTVRVWLPAGSGLRVRAVVPEREEDGGDLLPAWPLDVTVERTDAPDGAAVPAGFVLEVRVGGFPFHRRVPVRLPGRGEQLALALGRAGDSPGEVPGDLALRALPDTQPFFLYARNPGKDARTALIQLRAADADLPDGRATLKLEAGQTAPVVFAPPVPPPAPASTPPAAGTPAPPTAPAVPELPLLPGPLTFRLADAAEPDVALSSRPVQVRVAPPREYVRVTTLRYDPAGVGTPGRLTVGLRLRGRQAGPPVRARLVLDPARIPGLKKVDAGTLQGIVPADGSELRLYAEGIELDEVARAEGQFSLDVDGWPRAFLFRVTFPRDGSATTPREDERPVVRLKTPRFARDNPKQAFPVEVDNAPQGSRLLVGVGSLLPAEGPASPENLDADLVKAFSPPRDVRVGFRPDGSKGALVFRATAEDRVAIFDTELLTGERTLVARIVSADGKTVIAEDRRPLTLDNRAPTDVAFLDPPLKAKKDAPLMLRAAGRDRQSGLATVGVFIGKPTPDGALPAGVTPTPATPTPGDRTSWTATVPLTGERRGPTDFTVVFTNNVGLSSFATTTIDLVDSLPPATGAIAGRVSEGALGQPDLGVQLVGPDGKEKAKTKTDAKGGYRFNGLAPGAYKVVAAKIETDRKASLDVTVEAGKTTPADLDLFK